MAKKMKKKNSKKPKNDFLDIHHGTSNSVPELMKLARKNFEELLEKEKLNVSAADEKVKEKILDILRTRSEQENDASSVDLVILNNSIALENTVPKLVIQIQPGTAPDDEIASLLADMSLLYRKMGGSGIEFKLDGVEIKKEELV